MYVSLNWLKDFVEIPENTDIKLLGNEITLKTAEVESVKSQSKGLDDVVVGEIIEITKHPNADKLNLAKVNIGKPNPLRLIFGAMVEMNIGDKVPVAVAPTTLPTGVTIEKRKLRGETSEGMLCLDQELGLKEEGVSIQYFPSIKPGTPIAEAMDLSNDTILEFDNKSLTHRPDLWGHYGIAREIAAITGKKFKKCEPKITIPQKGESLNLKVEDGELCPRYCGLIIENVKIEESPEWLKKRLRATGHGIHNNIVDVTNYVLTELGQPLHAFDKNYIKGGIIVRKAKKGEKIKTLDGKERTLNPENLVIADHEKPVAIAGVIGGENSEINENTTAIILESANFNASSVRRTSVNLGIRTDAVQRFEKSLDPNLAELAIKRAGELILQICPSSKLAGPISDIKNFNEKPVKINLDIDKAISKIGVQISPKQIKEILESLEFKTKEKTKSTLEVTVPSHRSTKDITIEDDLIEEIARIYGYENIPATLPSLPTHLPKENTERFLKHRTRELLSYGLGMDEVYNYSFYGEKELSDCLMTEDFHMKLLNYLSEDQTHMRTTLIPNLLKNIRENVKHTDEIKIYEIGRTYKDINEHFPLEEKKIGGAIVKKGKNKNSFYEAKGIVETFLTKFGIKTTHAKEIKNAPYAHPVKALTYLNNSGETIAQVFEIHPSVSKNHNLQKHETSLFEINFSKALTINKSEKTFKAIPKFPAIIIDISVIIDRATEIETIKNAIQKTDQNLITEVKLFDIYEGENIEQNKKAVAFKVTLQSVDRTLTDEEMAETQAKIFVNLEALGGFIRR